MSRSDDPALLPLGATALLARCGDAIDAALARRITRLTHALDAAGIPGIVDLVPSYTTLLVRFDPARIARDELAGRLRSMWRDTEGGPIAHDPNAREIEIPVLYGGDAGPDLEDVARHAGLSPAEVAARHRAATYAVGAVGFAPGFAFLIGLPPELATPRRATPRTRVPPGSVGIAAGQTGVYSLPTPGGWNLIGRTPRVMFDPDDPSAELRPGDTVRFVPVKAAAVTFPEDATVTEPAFPDGALEIASAGVQTSVQDLGRPGQGRAGVTPGGAADRAALVAGNRLLGNPDGAAALEWTLLPPSIRFHVPARVALTGADPGWRLDGAPLPVGAVVDVPAGALLDAMPVPGVIGARGYVGVAGGIDVPEVRGSRSLDLAAGFGGGYGRPLRAGDRLPVGEVSDHPHSEDIDRSRPVDPAARPFRVVPGPEADRFAPEAWRAFLASSYTVDPQSNRMGLRLAGPAIAPEGGADIVSEGVVTGAVQVTGSGQPIVLLPGRATIGGYAKIATVIEADHDRLGQLRPGAAIRFVEVSLADAEAALAAWHPSVHGGLASDEEDGMVMDDPGSADAWTPEGVIRVIRELAAQDVRAFSLRVEAAGLEIAIDRGGGLPAPAERASQPKPPGPASGETPDDPVADDTDAVVAPLVGVFWQRPAPDQPPFVQEGDTIESGQVIGLIEVMKSFHEVTAARAGVVRRILVEDGATVEYGQPLLELAPPEG